MSVPVITIRSHRVFRSLFLGAAFVFLVLALLHLKVSVDVQRNYRPYIYDARYDLPEPQVIRAATLNFRTAAADVVWVQGVQFVAKSVVAHREADEVTYYARALVELDPYFYKVYAWHGAARMMVAGYPSPEDIEAANDLLAVGMTYFPHDWRLPYEAAANYIGFNRGVDENTRLRQLERAVQFSEAAASRSNAPEMMFFLTMRFRERLARLRASLSGSEAPESRSLPTEIDNDLLTRVYLVASSKSARESILRRLIRSGGKDKLAARLRQYATRQEAWYEPSDQAYLPFGLFVAIQQPEAENSPHPETTFQ